MGKRILLKGAILVDPSQEINDYRDLLIADGKIIDIAPSLEIYEDDVEVIDLEEKVIIPGMVDLHVHLREPGERARETIEDGLTAAIAWGITSVCCMPNTLPAVDNYMMVEYIKGKAHQANLGHLYTVGALTKGRAGQEMTDYASLIDAGAVAFSDDGNYVDNGLLMWNIFKYLVPFRKLVVSHCEDSSLVGKGVAHDGYYASVMGLKEIPRVAETVAVARDTLLAQATGGNLHIAHVSCAGTVEWIRWAKENGIKITAEVTPHHLLLTEECLEGFNTMAKMRPPLRSESDRQALLEGIRTGVIDIIATDHAPHKWEDKDCLFEEAAFGVSSLDYAVSLLLTELVHPGIISLDELVNIYSCKPAALMGLPAGTLCKGAVADIAVLDLHAVDTIDSNKFYSRGRNTPFDGRHIKGKPVMTFVEGELKMKDGKVFK